MTDEQIAEHKANMDELREEIRKDRERLHRIIYGPDDGSVDKCECCRALAVMMLVAFLLVCLVMLTIGVIVAFVG